MPRRSSARDQALQQAVFALQMQRPDEAERIAEEVLKASRSDPVAIQVLGQALLMQGRAEEAIPRLEKALRRSNDPRIGTQLAAALREAGRRDEAIAQLRGTIKHRPPFAPAFIELAQQLLSLDRHDEAIAVLQAGVKLLPEVPDLLIQLGYLHAAGNDRPNARVRLVQALAIAPDRVDAMYALAYVLRRDGDYAEAAKMFRRILGLKPDDAPARIGLGGCLLELRQPEDGFANLRTASRSNAQMYGQALSSLTDAARGRFWLRPSDAARFLRGS